LKDLLWKRNLEGKSVDTPEQKARIEKEIKEDVSKIADETVRGYYVQEMKNKIYTEFVEKNRPVREYKPVKYQKPKPQSFVRQAKTDLDDLVAKYVISALVCYPKLIEEYEERLLDFSVKDEALRSLYEGILDVVRDNPDIKDEQELASILDTGNYGDWRKLVDVRILKKQCPDIIVMRKDLDERIIEVQLRQLETDIRECKRVLESGNFNDEDYQRYEGLKKERDVLLSENEVF
jgi:DNA primase